MLRFCCFSLELQLRGFGFEAFGFFVFFFFPPPASLSPFALVRSLLHFARSWVRRAFALATCRFGEDAGGVKAGWEEGMVSHGMGWAGLILILTEDQDRGGKGASRWICWEVLTAGAEET